MTAPINSSFLQSNFNCKPGLYFKIILLFILSFFYSVPLQAQTTAEEWLAAAEEAVAEGRITDAGSAYSNAAHKQMESGDYEAAAENFKKAAEQFKKDGRIAQAGTETTNAATAYEAAAEKAALDGDHAKAAELYDKAAEQYEADERAAMAEAAKRKADHERTYPASVVITATGNTSGDIAEVTITNHLNSPQDISLPSGIIPSENNYQGYIIPQKTDVTVPPNSTHTFTVEGYCMDPRLPPPPPGSTLPSPNTWTPSSVKVTQVNEIIRVVNRLVATTQITTPFGKDGNAGDMLTQYTVWSTLPDVPLTTAELCDEIIRTFVSISGTPVNELSPDSKNALDYGILQMKDAIDQIIDEVGIPALTAILPSAASQLNDAPPSTHPEITATIKATGTGNTTGHVANLTMSNPTNSPVTVKLGDGPLYIPGEGGQPLAVPEIPAVPLAPGEKKTVPVNGYCTDIRVPPVPKGEDMPPVSKWVNLEPSTPSTPSPGVVNVPMQKAPSVHDAVDLLLNTPNATIPVSSAPCPQETITSQPILPGTNSVLQIPIDPSENPAVGVPLILDALNSIIQSYDQLKTGGRISTPFGNNALKERESVIQQTYWIYTSALRDNPYDKSEFVSMTNRQLEQNTGKKAEDLPAPEQEKYGRGIDDFWGTFSLVGTESKLLTSAPAQPATQPTTTQVFESFEPESLKTSKSGSKPEGTTTNPRQTVSDPTEAPTLVKDEAKGECKCGDITIKIEVWEMAPQPDGTFKGVGSPIKKTATASAAKSTEPHEIKVGKNGLKNGVRIGVDLESVSATCPCEGNAACDIFKDANEAKAHADAVKAHDKVVRDHQSALEKAKAALAKAQAALEEAGVKAKYDKAVADLTSAEAALKAARDARAAYDSAEKAYKEATDAHTAAKGKEAKASAKAVKDAAKIVRDKAKDANPTDSKIRTLEAAVKAAKDNVNRMEKDVKEAQDKINEINKKIADAMAKVLEHSSGIPSMKDGDGKDVAIGTLTEFNAVKQGNAKMEFKLTVSFQCTSPQCASTDCARTFVIKIEE